MEFVRDNEITEFADLVEYSLEHNELQDDYLALHTYYIKEYIASARYRKRDVEKAKFKMMQLSHLESLKGNEKEQ